MTSLTKERGRWIDSNEILQNGDIIDIHVSDANGVMRVFREATVTGYADRDDHDYHIISTDVGDFSYSNTVIFMLVSYDQSEDYLTEEDE